jgi:hypothetical protein
MKKYLLLIIVAPFLIMTSCATLGQMALKPSTLETITAIKDILNSSTFKAITKLQKLSNNGVEGILPQELKPALATLKTLGLGEDIDKVTKTIGDASNIALKESSAIMADAIKEVSFSDAVAIVVGGEDAATQVLKNAMTSVVKKRYSSVLSAQLDKTDANKYWPMAAGAYNLLAKNKVEPNLSDFIADKAVDAIFLAMGHEETQLRKDPASVGSAVVTKVFDYYVKNKRKA